MKAKYEYIAMGAFIGLLVAVVLSPSSATSATPSYVTLTQYKSLLNQVDSLKRQIKSQNEKLISDISDSNFEVLTLNSEVSNLKQAVSNLNKKTQILDLYQPSKLVWITLKQAGCGENVNSLQSTVVPGTPMEITPCVSFVLANKGVTNG